MNDRRHSPRMRTLRSGKILFNNKRSVVNCTVRNLSAEGACLQVESPVGIPSRFDLSIEGEQTSRPALMVWQSDHRVGVVFASQRSEERRDGYADEDRNSAPVRRGGDLVRNELLGLRAALDDVKVGVVLLDAELRAQFINRAFRKMWRLPDAKADSKPAFVALMYHGRDTRAYEIPEAELDAYVAERVTQVKAGDSGPRDIRLANGEVLRFQCTPLPSGGRVLTYTFVTDIVRYSDELEVLRAALDNVEQGIILLDSELHAQFMNRAIRRMSGISDEEAESRPHVSQLVTNARWRQVYGIPADELDAFSSRRIAQIKEGDPTPADLRHGDGRTIRSHCTVLPAGGRMLTYTDITDLVRHGEELQRLATTDTLTGLYNRGYFLARAEAEWGRFQRYSRPLGLLVVDIDRFKSINDQFGHDVGDRAIAHVGEILREGRRSSDVVARLGGDEFAVLLPETDLAQALLVADRLCREVGERPLIVDGRVVSVTLSIGAAEAKLSMAGVAVLMKAADQCLYDAKTAGRNRVIAAKADFCGEYDVAAE
jgi:diguanylate cyclase (GGDEF)-like protein/PAS domain S-box-containing protein